MELINRLLPLLALSLYQLRKSNASRLLVTDADCGGCNNGTCVTPNISAGNDEDTTDTTTLGLKPSCLCKGTGFIGEHCEIPCSLDCKNGGKCLPAVSSDNNEETCSCSLAVVNGNPYAGRFCEFGATKSCMTLGSQSKHSFCTNDGECADIVGDNEEHKNCICPDGYEGPHCEYIAGTEPTPTLSAANSAESSEESKTTSTFSPTNTIIGLIAGVSVCIFMLMVAFKIRAKKRERLAKQQQEELAMATEELAIVTDSEHENEII
mmetsp:Transcript_7627/g.15208  ORF Transcript_7627/g.15208 Transcript_7627/m.15208 type:complete len:265 (+) Transcript_7627:92-886(+)